MLCFTYNTDYCTEKMSTPALKSNHIPIQHKNKTRWVSKHTCSRLCTVSKLFLGGLAGLVGFAGGIGLANTKGLGLGCNGGGWRGREACADDCELELQLKSKSQIEVALVGDGSNGLRERGSIPKSPCNR